MLLGHHILKSQHSQTDTVQNHRELGRENPSKLPTTTNWKGKGLTAPMGPHQQFYMSGNEAAQVKPLIIHSPQMAS